MPERPRHASTSPAGLAAALADVDRSRSGANPSLNNPQNQTPNTLLLNAHQMCTHVQATRTARSTRVLTARLARWCPRRVHTTLHTPPVLRTEGHTRAGTGNSSVAASSRVSSELAEQEERARGGRRGIPPRLSAAPRRNAVLLRGQIGLSRGRGSRIGAVLAWFRREVGSCGGRREKREWEEAVSGFSARRRFGTFPVLQSAFLFSAIVSFGARFWCQD